MAAAYPTSFLGGTQAPMQAPGFPEGPESPQGLAPPPPNPSPFDLNVPLTDREREQLATQVAWEVARAYQDTVHRRGNMEQWRRDQTVQGPAWQ